jgi:hypothetical protein
MHSVRVSKNGVEVEDFSSFNLNKTKIRAVLDCSFRTFKAKKRFGLSIFNFIVTKATIFT